MATPVGFEGANHLISGEAAGCNDLEAFVGQGQFVSCWRLSPEELATVQETGVVWLSVYATQTPPVMVSGTALVNIGDRPARAEPIVPKRINK